MLDEKKVFKFPEAEIITLKFGTSEFKVKSYLSSEEQDTLIAIYMLALEDVSYAHAERALMTSVIETATDIKLLDDSEDGELKALVTIDQILANYPIWIKIKLAIKNYEDFRRSLDAAVEDYRERRRLSVSLGVRLENIADRVENFLKIVSAEGISPEAMADTRQLLKEINESPILQETVKVFKNNEEPSSKRSVKTKVSTKKKTKAK